MAEKKFSDLTTASQINETDIAAISQESNGVWGSFKATIGAIAQKIITGINFANAFNTNAKTVAGAVNEKLTANAVADIEVSPAESAHSEGDYLIYNGLLYLVIDDIAIGDALTTGAGGNIEAAQIADGIGGGGGHEILNDAGSALPQENKLQFKGVYSHDDSTNGKTVVDVIREMTAAEFEQLPAAEKVGVIRITDDNFVCDSTEVKYDNNISIKTKIDSIINLKYIETTITTDSNGRAFIGSELLSDSITKIMNVVVTADDTHNNTYCLIGKRYSGNSTNSVLHFVDNSNADVANATIKIRIWYADI